MLDEYEIPLLIVYAHRPCPDYFEPFSASVGRTINCEGVFDIRYWIHKGNVHENMANSLKSVRNRRYVGYLDEDIQFLDKNWIWTLIQDLKDNPNLASVATAQVKDEAAKFDYELYLEHEGTNKHGKLELVKWYPAHACVTDMSRVPDVVPDTKIPGSKGMSDVDYCLQMRKAGFDVAIDSRVVVYHPHKLFEDSARKGLANPTIADEQEIFPQQVLYMWKKWGEMYKELTTGFNDQWLPRIRAAFEKEGIACPW